MRPFNANCASCGTDMSFFVSKEPTHCPKCNRPLAAVEFSECKACCCKIPLGTSKCGSCKAAEELVSSQK